MGAIGLNGAAAEAAGGADATEGAAVAIPAFAAWVIVLGAKHGEMQRPKNVFMGLRDR
jgi:hypothetical protein